MMFCKKGCSNGIRAWSSATAVPSLKWLSSYLEATELHYVMYRLRQDRMDVIEINLIFLKLASDYDLSQSEFMSSRIQFPPHCDMLLSVGNYSVASNNESCHGPAADSIWWRPSCDHWIRCPHLAGIKQRRRKNTNACESTDCPALINTKRTSGRDADVMEYHLRLMIRLLITWP